jgi:AcrR family transcriptional regulator
MTDSQATRRQLIDAAEALFAERGIDAVSLREINRAAKQRNATALQYHFADRRGLLLAIMAKHHPEVEARRHAMLDELESNNDRDLRSMSAALVRPVASKLADPSGGRAYLRIVAQLVNRSDVRFDPAALTDPTDSTNRWRQMVAPLLPALAVDRLHRRFTAIRIMFVELARRAEGSEHADDRLFTSHLIDIVAAILGAPLSAETARLIEEAPSRDRKVGRSGSIRNGSGTR